MYREFKADPYFLQKYYLGSAFILPILAVLAAKAQGSAHIDRILPLLPATLLLCTTSFTGMLLSFLISAFLFFLQSPTAPAWRILSWVAAAVYLGIWGAVLLHNATHKSIKPRWLNRLVGELAGFQFMTGFPGFAIIHVEHHLHADDLAKDPHPPAFGEGFFDYVKGTGVQLKNAFYRLYAEAWGEESTSFRSWRYAKFLVPLNRIFRAALMLAVLGPEAFTFFFIPTYYTSQLTFICVNYFSHRRKEDGSAEALNLDYGLFRVINLGFSGLFYHRNHHQRPGHFNPMKLSFKEMCLQRRGPRTPESERVIGSSLRKASLP